MDLGVYCLCFTELKEFCRYTENMLWINQNGFMMNDNIIFLSNFKTISLHFVHATWFQVCFLSWVVNAQSDLASND